MTAEQSLAGAMGCASWRSHLRLREHAALARHGGTIRLRGSLELGHSEVLGLNEVGVTDLAMAAIWRYGPNAMAYAMSAAAEGRHLGADIAILHTAESRILLYQAKLATFDNSLFDLKSPVTKTQVNQLRRPSVVLQGTTFQVTGRLALYQADLTTFLDRCPCHHMPDPWREHWHWHPDSRDHARNDDVRQPKIGSEYYEHTLSACGCSPSGILAAPLPANREPVSKVAKASTWPWEFDTNQWLRNASPLDNDDPDEDSRDYSESVPQFEPYILSPATAPPDNAAQMASDLARQLRLPASTQLHLLALP